MALVGGSKFVLLDEPTSGTETLVVVIDLIFPPKTCQITTPCIIHLLRPLLLHA